MIPSLVLDPSCKFEEFSIQAEKFRVRTWGNVDESSAVALLVHGLGAHSGWFEAAAKELASRHFFVIAYDQKGFGSRSDKGLHSYRDWISDLVELVNSIKKKYATLPFYLMGNSMGGLVVMASSALVEPDGIVIFSPGFDGHPKTFSLPYKIRSVLSALLSPQKEVALPYGFEIVTRDKNVLTWLDNDTSKKVAVPGYMLFELLKLSKHVLANLKSVNVPILMITAGQEKVVNNEVNERLFKRLTAPFKKHVHMTDAWHDLMFDPQVDEVADEIKNWIDELDKSRRK